MEKELQSSSKSNLVLNNRNNLNITGVKKVKSTEPRCVIAVLDSCTIIITGTNLAVQQLNIGAGTLDISGLVNSIKYTNTASRRFSFKNMFR